MEVEIVLGNRMFWFYQIPKKSLLNIRSNIEYVAFYQSNKSFNENSGIKYYGKIKDIIEYKRSECREIECRKRSENEEYIRISFEWIKEIPKIEPIQYGTQIVTYTTLYLLLNAQNTHELKYKSNLEVLLYKKIKKIADKQNYSIKKINPNYHINNKVVQRIEDKVIKIDGWIVKFSELENYLKQTKIGVDVVLKDFTICSERYRESNPKHLRKSTKRLVKLQKDLSRKVNGNTCYKSNGKN